jgi:hypothetical protein
VLANKLGKRSGKAAPSTGGIWTELLSDRLAEEGVDVSKAKPHGGEALIAGTGPWSCGQRSVCCPSAAAGPTARCGLGDPPPGLFANVMRPEQGSETYSWRMARPFAERTIDAAIRDGEAAALRRDGLTYREIAKAMGCSVAGAHDMVKRALREAVREPAEELRTLELERLDTLYTKTVIIIETGSTKEVLNAIDRALRIMERRSKLLGLDAPVKQDVRITDSLDSEIERLAAELLFVENLGSLREEGVQD